VVIRNVFSDGKDGKRLERWKEGEMRRILEGPEVILFTRALFIVHQHTVHPPLSIFPLLRFPFGQ
jgi:hypothetical protein